MIKNLIKNGLKSSKLSTKALRQVNRQLNTSLCLLGVKGTEIKMPVLSPTMTEGTIVKWHKKEGDPISPGDMICEVQTDKAVVALEIEDEGILAKILVSEDAKNVKIGDLIALYVEQGENWKDVEIPEHKSSTESKTFAKEDKKQESKITSPISNDNLKISPSVRNLLHQYDIDANNISPTGPKNILLKSDVLGYIKKNNLKSISLTSSSESSSKEPIQTSKKINQPEITTENNFMDIELTNMRRTIAKRLTESKSTIPHAYMKVACNVNSALQYQAELKAQKLSVSFNDVIIKAVAIALKKVPQVNSIFSAENQQIQLLRSVDISIAVATENGLITPIIKDANHLSINEINQQVKHLANKAREGKLQPNEFIGGSFSISNLGMFGISEFSAVINPPQTAILAIGSPKSIVRNFERVDRMLTCQLSYDARVLDEELVAKFLEAYKENLENPVLLESDGSNHRRLSHFA